MRVLIIALVVLGGVLPIAGVIWAAATTWLRYRDLDRDLTAISRLAQAGVNDTKTLSAVRIPSSSYTTVLYTLEEVERSILRAALDDLKGPAALGVVGIVCGTAGGLLALWF